MIVNCPIYVEVEAKFTPEEGKIFTRRIRKLLRDHLLQATHGSLKVRDDEGRILTIKFLSEQEALTRFGTKVSKMDNPPQQ